MTSNPREIERKFLVTGDGWKRRATGHTHIEQGYLAKGRRATIRVRIRDGKEATLTIKSRERGISRQGDGGVRKLLVLGASALLRHRRASPERATEWQRGILARRPVKVAVVAQAAKNARIAWAMLQSGQSYRCTGGGAAAATAN